MLTQPQAIECLAGEDLWVGDIVVIHSKDGIDVAKRISNTDYEAGARVQLKALSMRTNAVKNEALKFVLNPNSTSYCKRC